MPNLVLPFFSLFPVMIAIFIFVFSTKKNARIAAVVFQTIFTIITIILLVTVRDNPMSVSIGEYVGARGIILFADSFVAVFIALTATLFLAVAFYSMNESDSRLFWFLLFILESTIIGLFLTQDLFNIFVMAEVSTIIISVLLMYNRLRRVMYRGLVFIMLNVLSMLFYLLGLAFFYSVVGVFDVNRAIGFIAYIDPSHLFLPYALIMTAIGFKCALIPLFSFTPKTVLYPDAPSGVGALLSGIHIKANIYLFIKLQTVFEPVATDELFLIFAVAASLTAVFMAMCQTNIKMILAYHTMSQVGLIMIGLNSGSDYSRVGGLYHIISHGIFKSALFLTAGILLHSYGTLNVYKIRGVFKRSKVVGLIMAFAILGITGAPFFIGSISKYFITTDVAPWINIAVIIISLGTIISFIKYATMLFGDCNNMGDKVVPDGWRLSSTVPLGIICLIGGIFGTPIINYLFQTNATISVSSYITKTIIFFLSAIVGFIIYKYVVSKNKLMKRIAGLEFSFNSVVVSLVVFFVVILGYLQVVG